MRRNPSTSVGELSELNRAQTGSEHDTFTPFRYRQFVRLLGASHERILDVGCNTGVGGAVLRSAFPESILDGVDLVPERFRRIPPGTYDCLWAGPLWDYEPGDGVEYDAVLMGELIEHVPLDAIDDFLEAVLRLLCRGGLVIMTTPNPHYALIRRRSGGTVLGGPHVSVHCPAALRQYLEYKGFRVKSIRGTGRVSRALGQRMPLAFYGSYLLVASRP